MTDKERGKIVSTLKIGPSVLGRSHLHVNSDIQKSGNTAAKVRFHRYTETGLS